MSRSVSEMLGLPESFHAPGFAAMYKKWSERQRHNYRQSIEESLQGGLLTKEAHEAAVAAASGVNSPGKRLASMMRSAVEHPSEFKF